MVLGMSGRAKPTFIFMMATSPVHRQMNPHAPAELQPDRPAFSSPGHCEGTARLCHALPQGSAADLHVGGPWMVLNVRATLSASKGWTFICSIGHLRRRHASSESGQLPVPHG